MSGGSTRVSVSPRAAVHRISISDDTVHGLEIGGSILGVGLASVGIAALAGAFITDSDLRQYLQKIDDTNKIEGNFNSDQGAQQIYAYLWELEHQQQTGLARRENLGLNPDGTADHSVGLARWLRRNRAPSNVALPAP